MVIYHLLHKQSQLINLLKKCEMFQHFFQGNHQKDHKAYPLINLIKVYHQKDHKAYHHIYHKKVYCHMNHKEVYCHINRKKVHIHINRKKVWNLKSCKKIRRLVKNNFKKVIKVHHPYRPKNKLSHLKHLKSHQLYLKNNHLKSRLKIILFRTRQRKWKILNQASVVQIKVN